MALPTIVKIFNRSDFTVQLPLADGYDGQEFRFTLYTCGEPENGWVASYIDGVYTNCTVDGDIVVIYVNNNNKMNPGCLTVQSEYDYYNSHFRDNEDNVKDNYKTNIYLVAYRTNAFSAEFKPTNIPDLTNVSDYVTFSDLEAMSYATTTYVADYVAAYGGNVDLSAYVTKVELQEDLAAYVTKEELNEAGYLTSVPSNYATKGYAAEKANEAKAQSYSYVVDYVATYAPTVDLSAYAKKSDLNAYVTKEELNAAGYVTSSVLDGYVTDTELDVALDGYATKSYVVDYVATYGGNVDLSSYVTKDELNQAGYLTSIPSEYVTENELSGMGYADKTYVANYVATYGGNVDLSSYATKSYVAEYVATYAPEPDLSSYATKSYVAEYVATYAPTVDLSSYVTKDELNQAGYLTSIPSDYATYEAISQMGYITSIPAEYVTESELSNMGYATITYVTEYVATYAPSVDLSSYVTKDELNQAGYISSIPSEYITESELNNMSYADKAYVANYVATYAPSVDLSSYVTKDELNQAGYISSIPSEYITESELNNMSYATTTYVADYVFAYGGNVDLSAYVTKTELNNAGYITSIPSEYITESELASTLTSYAKTIWLGSYVKKTELNQILEDASYATVMEITQYDYDMLSTYEKANGYLYVIVDADDYEFGEYVTYAYLVDYVNTYASPADLSSYATKSYVADYVATYAPQPDLSAYVTKDELNNAGYITSIPSDYATYDAISQMGYITSIPSDYATYDAISQMGYLTSIPSEYITQDELSANAYLTQHQDLSAYAKLTDLNSYVTKTELNNAGYLTSIPSDYATYAAISQMGYLTAIPSEYITQDELSANAYLTQHQDLSAYATKSYVADYVATYAPQPDLSSYVTKTELNNAGYISSIPSDYATYEAISQMGYITSSDLPVIDESIIPKETTTYTLGSSSYIYSDLYASSHWFNSNSRIRNLSGGVQIIKNGTAIAQFKDTPELSPNSNKSASLGASDNMWSATYTESLYINGYTGLSSYNFQYDSATNTLTITV